MILAIDSGGTKTRILYADETGRIADDRTVSGFALPDDPEDVPIADLQTALSDMCPDPDLVSRVVVNLGGKNTGQFYNTVHAVFDRADISVFRESSGVIGEQIRKKYAADIIFFCGTGCIVLAGYDKGYFILDGWGKDLGDFGSGYFIGINAIKQSLAELEGRAPLSGLARCITGENKPFSVSEDIDVLMKKRDEVRARIMPLERARVAALAKTVLACADENDAAALSVFDEVGQALASTALRAIERSEQDRAVTVAFCGGIAAARKFWEKSFSKALADRRIAYRLIFPETDFAHGALEYAIKQEGKDL